MTEQEKKEFQALKERVAYLEGILSVLQGQQGVPTIVPTVPYPYYWEPFKVTCNG